MATYNLWCSKNEEDCIICNKKGDTQAQVKNVVCPFTKKKLKLLGESCNMLVSEKMTHKEIKADRKKRATNHFNKEVLPTLGVTEKLHHLRKKKLAKK